MGPNTPFHLGFQTAVYTRKVAEADAPGHLAQVLAWLQDNPWAQRSLVGGGLGLGTGILADLLGVTSDDEERLRRKLARYLLFAGLGATAGGAAPYLADEAAELLKGDWIAKLKGLFSDSEKNTKPAAGS